MAIAVGAGEECVAVATDVANYGEIRGTEGYLARRTRSTDLALVIIFNTPLQAHHLYMVLVCLHDNTSIGSPLEVHT